MLQHCTAQEPLVRVWLLPNARGRYVRVRAGGHDDAPGCLELGDGQGEVKGRVVVGLRCVWVAMLGDDDTAVDRDAHKKRA